MKEVNLLNAQLVKGATILLLFICFNYKSFDTWLRIANFENIQATNCVVENESESSLFYACQCNLSVKTKICYTSNKCKSDKMTIWFLDSSCPNI